MTLGLGLWPLQSAQRHHLELRYPIHSELGTRLAWLRRPCLAFDSGFWLCQQGRNHKHPSRQYCSRFSFHHASTWSHESSYRPGQRNQPSLLFSSWIFSHLPLSLPLHLQPRYIAHHRVLGAIRTTISWLLRGRGLFLTTHCIQEGDQ